MGKSWVVAASLFAVLTLAGADGSSPIPADFRLHVDSFGLGKDPVYTEEIVVREGRAYVFPSISKEVVIIEPARGRLEILDVGRRIQAEVSFQTLDQSLSRLKTSLLETAEKLGKEGGRARRSRQR